MLGDAERSAIDEPPARRAMEAEGNQPVPDLLVRTNEDGTSYVEDAGPAKE